VTRRRPDTTDKLLEISAKLRRRFRTRDTIKGPVRDEIRSAPPTPGENRKAMRRKVGQLQQQLIERQCFHRLVTVQARYYLATHRLEPQIALMCVAFRLAHEARYPGWGVAEEPRLPASMSAHGVGSMILDALRAGRPAVLPPGPLVDRLNAAMLRNPIDDRERAIVEAAKQRVKVALGRRAHAAALAKGTTTKRSASRKAQALALLRAGHTQVQVAEQLGIDVRTVRRYQRER
jgi:DNA-binding NarL/FixJ family response regulator